MEKSRPPSGPRPGPPPLPQKKKRGATNEFVYEKMIDDERHTMQLELAKEFEESFSSFESLQNVHKEKE